MYPSLAGGGVFFTWGGPAVAGELELAVEQGLVDAELERFGAARAEALAVLRQEPGHAGARALYVEASAAAGYGRVGQLELAGEASAPPWAAAEAALADGVGAADAKTLKAQIAALRTGWPEAPDLLLPLWSVERDPVAALRNKELARLRSALPTATDEGLLRTRRLALAIDDAELVASVDTLLEGKPFDVPPRAPLGHPELRSLAQQWSEKPDPDPFLYPSEVGVAGTYLDEIWTKAARFDELSAFWTTMAGKVDDPRPFVRVAEASLRVEKVPEARTAIETALGRAAGPRELDHAVLGTERLRQELGAVLHERAKVAEKEGDVVAARGDLGTAFLLTERVLDGAMAERLSKLVAPYVGPLEQQCRSRTETPAQVCLGRAAERSLDATTAPDVLRGARDARMLALEGTGAGSILADDPGPWLELMGDAWFVEGRAQTALGNDALARSALVLASLFLPDDAEVWDVRARAHEKLGENDAAFAALAVARGKGTPDTGERLKALYAGPGDWEVVATALGGTPPDAAVVAALPKRRRGSAGAAVGGSGGARGAGPKLGQPFPSLSFDDFSIAALRGRVLVISAFKSDCEECLQMLPSYARLARRLRTQGFDLVVVGLSLDEDEEQFRETAIVARHWGQLARDPGLAGKLGIRRVPTTWVVDRTGTTRYFADHWLSSQELEAMVRQVP